MKSDLWRYAIENLIHRKMRSWLTVLSILIGIMAIFALVSFGEGVKKYTDDVFQEMGSDKIMVQVKGFGPPGTSAVKLTQSDVDTLRHMKDVSEATQLTFHNTEVRQEKDKKGKWVYVAGEPVTGVERILTEETFAIEVENGRALRSGDKYKAVIGYNYQVPDKIFKDPIKIRDTIYINNVAFKVVGFYELVGNPQDDSNIYIPIETAEEVFGVSGEYEFIIARSIPGADPRAVADKAERELRRNRGVKEGNEDFYVQTFEEALETFDQVIGVINGVLVLIALISVVVSAVNIANTMYTAVLERTREIGIMKAIGATKKDIITVFLIEAGMLGMIGGAVGILCGYVIAKIGGFYAASAGFALLKPYFPWWLIVGCLVFSLFVGILSGVLPALQASKQKPVDALRYE